MSETLRESEIPKEPKIPEDMLLCPKCQEFSVECKYIGDTGTVDHYYTFRHQCSKCGYEATYDNFGCAGQERGEDQEKSLAGNCPNCGKPA